jgi:glycosyltransferase involved in cell wall biosynthesis
LFELKKIAKKGTMEVVYNGIRTSKFLFSQIERNCKRESLSVPDSCYMILSVGRLVEQKNHKLLLSAIKEVVDMGFVIRLYLVGDGPLRQFLEDRAQELEIENQVFFMPSQKDISSFLCACDVFVLPSSWEGFGLVVTEAMACERKIVATNCGGVEEVLGDVGWLVDRDNLDALVKGILSALNLSKSASQILGKRARKRVLEKFSIEQSGKSYLSMYRDCLKKRT